MQNYYQLEGSGFVFSFIHFMWLHDPLLKNVPCIHMPETIQIYRAQPVFWYFCRNGRMFRKGKERLNKAEIRKHFENKKREVVSVWAYHNKDHENKVHFEYLNLEQTLALIDSNDAELNGYLQEFVYPKGDFNNVIRAVWSENMCLMDSIRNVNPILNSKISLYQRLITFECNTGPVKQECLNGSILPQQIETLCNTFASHIRNVTSENKQVRQMELMLRIDPKGRIIVLFCSFLKLKQQENSTPISKPVLLAQTNLIMIRPLHTIPQKISQKIFSSATSQLDFTLKELCIACDQQKTPDDFLEVRMKELLEDWGLDHHNQEDAERQRLMIRQNLNKKLTKSKQTSTNDQPELKGHIGQQPHLKIKIQQRYQLPPVVRKLYPHMKLEDFEEIRRNEAFLSKALMICTECFLTKMSRCRTSELDIGPYYIQKLRGQTSQVTLSRTKQTEALKRRIQSQDSHEMVNEEHQTPSIAPLLFRFNQKKMSIDTLGRSTSSGQRQLLFRVPNGKDAISQASSNLKTSWHNSQSMVADLYSIYMDKPKKTPVQKRLHSITHPHRF